MKVTYKGKHVLILPLRGKKPLVLGPGMVGSIDEIDWDLLHGRSHLKAMQRKGTLVVSGAKPDTTVEAEPEEMPLPEIEEMPVDPRSEEQKLVEDFGKLAWKRAAFQAKTMEDARLVRKLYELEDRPSVKKALEDRLIDLEIAEEESAKPVSEVGE